jgi:hypothetical protein
MWKPNEKDNLKIIWNINIMNVHAMKSIAQFSQGPYPKWVLIKHHIEQVLYMCRLTSKQQMLRIQAQLIRFH